MLEFFLILIGAAIGGWFGYQIGDNHGYLRACKRFGNHFAEVFGKHPER